MAHNGNGGRKQIKVPDGGVLAPLLKKRKVYLARWWICFLFCWISMVQALSWNIYSPIEGAVKHVFGWNDNLIGWLANTAGIVCTLLTIPSAALMQKYSLRSVVLLGAVTTAMGCGFRLIPVHHPRVTHQWIALTSMVFNGVGGAICSVIPATLSATWFPVNERTTATAVMTLFNYAGVAISFVLGPLVVGGGGGGGGNGSSHHNHSADGEGQYYSSAYKHQLSDGGESWGPGTSGSARARTFHYDGNTGGSEYGGTLLGNGTSNSTATLKDIERLYLIEAIASGAAVLLTLLYFPSQPPTPPTLTKSLESDRENQLGFLEGLRKLKSRRFWALALAFGIPLGISSGWNGVLAVNLVQPGTGFTDEMVGWLGFWMTAAGCTAGIAGGWVAGLSFAKRRKKRIVLWIYVFASISLAIFSLSCIDIIPRTKPILYASAIVAGMCLNAPVPMFFELCVEETYPLPESTSVGVLVLLLNAIQSIYLFIPLQQVGTAWCNWALTGSMVLFTIVLLPLKENYKRTNLDDSESGGGGGGDGGGGDGNIGNSKSVNQPLLGGADVW